MSSLFKKIFFENFGKKIIALIIAITTWYHINSSSTNTKTISEIPVKLLNLHPQKTIEGISPSGYLKDAVTLTLTGNDEVIDNLTNSDLEIVIDANNNQNDWKEQINIQQLVSLNPEINIERGISKIQNKELSISLSKKITEKIPVSITAPVGEAPAGYLFLDIWPYDLYVHVTGSEQTIKKLKAKGLRLTFNLNDIAANDLESLFLSNPGKDVISYYVPTSWKKIDVPDLSSSSILIDDAMAKFLRIDFIKKDVLPIKTQMQIGLYFPTSKGADFNPTMITLQENDFVIKKNGLYLLNRPLYAQGVSQNFLDTIEDMMQIFIYVDPYAKKDFFWWNVHCIIPLELENLYVTRMMTESNDDENSSLNPKLREDFLRNRFRNYMNKLRLFLSHDKKLHLSIHLEENKLKISPIE